MTGNPPAWDLGPYPECCTPDSLATTCSANSHYATAGCGVQRQNNCGQTVTCNYCTTCDSTNVGDLCTSPNTGTDGSLYYCGGASKCSVCGSGQTWDAALNKCMAAQCGATGTLNQPCSGNGVTNASQYYCSLGQDNQLPSPGYCCAVGYYYDAGVAKCISTNACDNALDTTNYCGSAADSFPASLSTFIARNPQCIGSGSTGAKLPGMSACCAIPTKYGQSPYYDWTDANGTLAGVSIY